jgi:hypothetical protein
MNNYVRDTLYFAKASDIQATSGQNQNALRLISFLYEYLALQLRLMSLNTHFVLAGLTFRGSNFPGPMRKYCLVFYNGQRHASHCQYEWEISPVIQNMSPP